MARPSYNFLLGKKTAVVFHQRERGNGRCRSMLLCAGILVAVATQATAGGISDLLTPDALNTSSRLAKQTEGLADPAGRQCVAVAGTLTLSASVDLALCRNPVTRSAWASAREAAAALGAAEGAWLPSVTANGAETRSSGKYLNTAANLTSSTETNRDAVISLSWTLYDFGSRGSKISSAASFLDAATASLGNVVQQTVFTVVQAYYGVVAADASLAAAHKTETVHARSLEIARALQTGGVATLADVLQAQTAHEEAIYARIQAEQSTQLAHSALAVALGLSADQPLRLAADPVPSEVPGLSGQMANLMAEASRQRPDLKAALANRDKAVADVGLARAAGRPVISVGAGKSFVSNSAVAQQDYNTFSLNVTFPLFSGFSKSYGVRQAEAGLEASEATLEQARLAVSQSVWNAYYHMNAANSGLSTTAMLIKTAENNEEVALGRYKSGVGTILDVLTAESAAASARQLRINSELDWQVARAQLALALGKLTGTDPLAKT
jgi:TolC family type I secretion outer membrane protein